VTFWELLIAHAVKLAILIALTFVFLRRRHRECWSFTAYLMTVLLNNSLVSFWPQTFFDRDFYVISQGCYDVLKLLIALEIAHRVFRLFPGARRLVNAVVLSIVAISTMTFLVIPRHAPYQTWFEWQPRIVASTVWLFTATAFLVLWYRIPVQRWHRDILLGFTAYLLVFVTLLGILRDHGWDLRVVIGTLDAIAYLGLVSWWAWASWRREEELALTPSVARRLGFSRSSARIPRNSGLRAGHRT
jgi:hypothetical protein